MQRELLIAKRKKAQLLHAKGWPVNKIARHLVSNWSSVKHWIEMEDIHSDHRGWKKGRLRKYNRKVEARVLHIRQELRKEESYFFGPDVVQANYGHLYPEDEPPTISFIAKTIREAGWTKMTHHPPVFDSRRLTQSSKVRRDMYYVH